MTQSVGERLQVRGRTKEPKNAMSEPLFHPDWGIFLFAIPFFCALRVGILRLDARFARAHRRRTMAPAVGILDRGRGFFRDPDGHRRDSARRVK
jgi:hypothetical protein